MAVYGDFDERHPEYDPDQWKSYRAFYSGGARLLKDQDLLKEVFPRHCAEKKDVYEERVKRAYYTPYAGQIIDSIVSALMYKPIGVEPAKEGAVPDAEGKVPLNTDEFYPEFLKNCAPAKAKPLPMNQLLRHQIQTALQTRVAWTLVDLPDVPELAEPLTVSEADALDVNRAYACAIEPERVINWEEDETGELENVLIHEEKRKWGGPGTKRDMVTEYFTFYTKDAWARWSITYKETNPPQPGDVMKDEGGGPHTFGRVPVSRLVLPDGLHAMGKIESMAREHFNKSNALSWSQLKNLLPVFYAKVEGTELDPQADDATQKLLNQPYGPGRMLIIGANDEIGYAAPDPAVYESAWNCLVGLRDEMHRVLHAMAQSVDNSGAALKRSGESKQMDQEAMAVVLRALGVLAREHVEDLFRLAHAGRQDNEATEFRATGMDEFSGQSLTELVEQAMGLASITIPSKAFMVRWLLKICKEALADEWNEELEALIKADLEAQVSNEQFDQPSPREEFEAANEQADKALQVKAAGAAKKPGAKK